MDKQQALQRIDQEAALFCADSDAIWDCPETAYQEETAARILCDRLEAEGFSVTRGLAGIATAFLGRWGEGRPVIGFLGEYDALSGLSQEAGSCEKRPLPDIPAGHGCGHNLLGAGALAAASAYKAYLEENRLPGTVLYFGCPAEEGGSGKAFLARDHVFDELDAAITWHPGDSTQVFGGSSLANCQVYYRFHGTSAHAAACPHLGRSALDAVELMNVGVQFLREHMIPEARVHYAITNTGGYSPNVVQPEAEVLYLIRSPKNIQVRELHERVTAIARGAAEMTGTRMEEDFVKACSNLVPNDTLCELMWENVQALPVPQYTEEERSYAKAIRATVPKQKTYLQLSMELLGSRKGRAHAEGWDEEEPIFTKPLPYEPTDAVMPGSTDVGDVSCVCPTVQCYVTTQAAGSPGHSWQVVAQGKSGIAHKGMIYAAKIMAATAIDLCHRPDVLEAAKAELKDRLAEGAGSYVPPMPAGVRPRMIQPGKQR